MDVSVLKVGDKWYTQKRVIYQDADDLIAAQYMAMVKDDEMIIRYPNL